MRLLGRREEDELDDFSSEPGLLSDPDGRRVLSSYGVCRPEEEASVDILLSLCAGETRALRLAGREFGFEAWKEGAGLALPSRVGCIAARSSRERLVGKSGWGSLLVDATASACWLVFEGLLAYGGMASTGEPEVDVSVCVA